MPGPQARDAKRAAVAAGGAMVANKPLAALAALLRAHELHPQSATYLANLAAVLSYIGMPREALVILDSPIVRNGQIASPLGMGGQAGALNTRGYSLLQLGKYSEAEAALREAIARSPNLIEAKFNLAFALWMQDDPQKKEEGGRLIAAVWRRNPRQSPKNNTGKKTPPSEPEKPSSEEIPIEIFESDKTGTANLDLSRGKRLKLPDLKIPSSLEASVAMSPKYKKLMGEVQAVLERLSQRREQVSDIVEERAPRLNRTMNEYKAMKALLRENVRQHPTIRPFWEKAQKAFINNNQGVPFSGGLVRDVGGVRNTSTDLFEALPEDFTPVPSQLERLQRKYSEIFEHEERESGGCRTGSCVAQARRKYDLVRCATIRDAHGKWRSAIHDYDTALRNYLQASYKHMTAIVANIPNPEEHELFRTEIEIDIYEEWLALIIAVDSISDASSQGISYCRSIGEVIGDDLENLQAEKADNCPNVLKGANKVKVDLEFISVSFNCETIGVELSSPWLGLFVEGEAKFKGGWISKYQGATIGFGIKAGAEVPGLPKEVGAGVEGKAGGYVKLDSDGNIKDAGFKAGVTVSTGIEGSDIVGAVETGTDVELTILPALGLPLPKD